MDLNGCAIRRGVNDPDSACSRYYRVFYQIHYFPPVDSMSTAVVEHVRSPLLYQLN
jgi:hypothetical protein